ncbi:MAG: HlyC/CorC family transporter [Myxococcales bacterium]|nr:HlyC/CorC family transporter [Myxococcales bacterium]MCB9644753.1 HlyC/CorC family transporter [Myxococcales bacterium]
MDSVPLAEGLTWLYMAASSATTWVHRLGEVSNWEWLLILFCLFFSAIFSASETALTALTYAKIEQLIDKDSARYGRLKLWLEHPNRVLTTILVGNNLVNILASSLATTISQRIFQNQGVAIAVGVMTFFILVFGEIVPKTYAKHHATQVAHRVFPILQLSYWGFYVMTGMLVTLAAWAVRIFGGNIHRSGPFMSEEDLEYMISLGTREGVLHSEKERLLKSVLEFDDITLREIMVPRINVVALSVDASRKELLELAQDASHSRIPVYRDNMDHIVGILYLRDLFRMYTANGESGLGEDWAPLLRTPYFVPSTMKVSDLLSEFQRRKSHMAIVVDEFGGTMGLVTLEDILEEIVGEIHDEYDKDEEQDIVELEPGKWQASAQLSIRELEELLDVEFPDEGDYETLGGFITSESGRVPQVGEVLERFHFTFHVLEADERHVRLIEIKRISIEEPEQTAQALPTPVASEDSGAKISPP